MAGATLFTFGSGPYGELGQVPGLQMLIDRSVRLDASMMVNPDFKQPIYIYDEMMVK